jgi:hypothetical protein
MVEWLAGNRIIGTTAERPTASLQSPNVGGWKEIDRMTLGSVGDTITVSSLDNKKYYMVLGDKQPSGTADFNWRVGNGSADPNNNYSRRQSSNGGTDTYNEGYNRMFADNGGSSTPSFQVGYFVNISGKQKLNITHSVSQGTAGAGTEPTRRESVNKWNNTSNPINVIQGVNVEGGDFAIGSEVVVLGWDPTDTHTDNFWEELYSNELSTDNQNFDTSTISAKKYLWLQFYQKGHTGNSYLKFNNDTGYSRTHSINGAADANPVTSQSQLTNVLTGGTGDSQTFTNMFIINTSAKDKLMIYETTFNASGNTGVSNAPQHIKGACKWGNTSEQITSIQVTDNGGAGFDTGSFLKIWGHD